ncbi:MAG: arginine N-succinyltransferase [Myxococcota bacterium]
MYLIRDATEGDLPGLARLARSFNTVNLPDDEGELRDMLDTTVRSFAGRIRKPMEREYLFVMEDTETGDVIGTSQIMAQHGTREAPHIYLDVLEEDRYSDTVDRLFKHKVLRIGFDYDGPTEIGGLVLDPTYRRRPGKLGKQLSFVRFVFMAMHRDRFRDVVIAELLPPLGEGGRSALWEALGRRFTGMNYREADLISKHNKEFIRNLFPTGMIYASLFDDEAQEVIGKVGPQTEGVRRMLESIGFTPVDRIDPFDGGPHFEARTEELWPVTQTRCCTAEIGDGRDIAEAPGESAEGLVAWEPPKKLQRGHFRAMWSDFRHSDDGKVELPAETAAALGLAGGEQVHALTFARHLRM